MAIRPPGRADKTKKNGIHVRCLETCVQRAGRPLVNIYLSFCRGLLEIRPVQGRKERPLAKDI